MQPSIGFVTQQVMSFEEALSTATDGAFDYIEVLMDGQFHRSELASRATAIDRQLTQRGLDAMVHLPFPIDLGSPHEHHREGGIEELGACLDAAAALGAEKAVVHPDGTAWTAAWDHETVRPLVCDSLSRLHDRADDRGIELCAENLFDSPHTIDDMPALLDATPVSMTLDTGHARVSGYDASDTAAFVRDHADRVRHVHLNDTRRPADEHLPFGAGTIDFGEILGAFPDGWDGTLSLEIFTPSPSYVVESKDRLETVLADIGA
ncbi:MAG: sugar phosphate isomerase/epimerase family protein [Salinirussus sp.]